jgi:hypothetical protein
MVGGKTIASGLMLALALAFAAPGFAAPKCSPLRSGAKGCKNEIKACVAAQCASITNGKQRRKCKKITCKKDLVNACKDANGATCASPSGAFVD